jgi:hypothetical protein
MSKAMTKRRKNPIAKRNPAFTYTKAAAIGALIGGVGAAAMYTGLPRWEPPSRAESTVKGVAIGATIATVAALLYREYQVYGV